MIVLYVILAILALIIILFHIPFRLYVCCNENKISLILAYLFFKVRLYPKPKNKKSVFKTKKKKEKKLTNKTTNKEETQKKQKKKLIPEKTDDKIGFIINVLQSSGKALRKFTKRIKIKNIKADIDISDEDACECAIKFGKANIAVFNILSFAGTFFKIKKKHININCVYNKPESIYNFSFNVNFTVSAASSAGIAFIFTFIVNNIKANRQAKKAEIPQT